MQEHVGVTASGRKYTLVRMALIASASLAVIVVRRRRVCSCKYLAERKIQDTCRLADQQASLSLRRSVPRILGSCFFAWQEQTLGDSNVATRTRPSSRDDRFQDTKIAELEGTDNDAQPGDLIRVLRGSVVPSVLIV